MMNFLRKKLVGIRKSASGFTLIEVLVVLALTGVIMSSVYGIYIATIQAATDDEDRVEIQQSQRFSIDFMMRELRHIGYDLDETDQPTLVAAGADYIYFTADMNGDGALDDANEHIIFCVSNDGRGVRSLGYYATNNVGNTGFTFDASGNITVNPIDTDNDGFSNLDHTHPGLADHDTSGMATIEALEFNYTLSDGTETTTPTLNNEDLNAVREIDISLLTRAENSDSNFDATQLAFQTASGANWAGFANDGFRRMILVSTVRLRNMGI